MGPMDFVESLDGDGDYMFSVEGEMDEINLYKCING